MNTCQVLVVGVRPRLPLHASRIRSSAASSVVCGQPKLSRTQPGRPKSTPLDRHPCGLEKCGGIVDPETARVDPRQVGRFDMAHGQAGHAGKVGFDTIAIAA